MENECPNFSLLPPADLPGPVLHIGQNQWKARIPSGEAYDSDSSWAPGMTGKGSR